MPHVNSRGDDENEQTLAGLHPPVEQDHPDISQIPDLLGPQAEDEGTR